MTYACVMGWVQSGLKIKKKGMLKLLDRIMFFSFSLMHVFNSIFFTELN